MKTALREQRAALRRSRPRQAVKHTGRFGVEFARARRQRRKFDMYRSGNRAARNLSCTAHVDELWRRGTIKQHAQSRWIERLNYHRHREYAIEV